MESQEQGVLGHIQAGRRLLPPTLRTDDQHRRLWSATAIQLQSKTVKNPAAHSAYSLRKQFQAGSSRNRLGEQQMTGQALAGGSGAASSFRVNKNYRWMDDQDEWHLILPCMLFVNLCVAKMPAGSEWSLYPGQTGPKTWNALSSKPISTRGTFCTAVFKYVY